MLEDETPPPGDTAPAAEAAEAAGAPVAVAAAEVAAEPVAEATAEAGGEPVAEAAAEAVAPDAAAAAPAVPDMSPADCAAQLAQRFPALFAAGRALPIKLRIQQDIQARAPGVFTRKVMSLFLHRYTTSTAYLKALVASPHRFDLDGAPAGDVAAEHREAALLEVQRRQALMQERRAAQRKLERPPQRPAIGSDATPAQPPADGAAPAPETRPQQRPRRDDRRPPPQRLAPAGRVRAQDRGQAAERSPQPPRPPAQQARSEQQPDLPPAELQARRDRAALLRAYESSTLTKANFCVLKRVSEAELDAALAQAQLERGGPAQAPRPGR